MAGSILHMPGGFQQFAADVGEVVGIDVVPEVAGRPAYLAALVGNGGARTTTASSS